MRETGNRETIVAALDELPPSAKLVFKILQYEGRLTREQLSRETKLTDRTLRDATAQLRNIGAITIEHAGGETRTPVYAIAHSFEDSLGSP